MKIKDFQITTELLDNTQLNDEELEVANAIYAAYGPVFLDYTLNRGINAVIGLAIGATLRAAKANLEQGVQVATLADVKALERG